MALFLWLKVNQLVRVKLLLGGKNLESEDRGTTFSYIPPSSAPISTHADHTSLSELLGVAQGT